MSFFTGCAFHRRLLLYCRVLICLSMRFAHIPQASYSWHVISFSIPRLVLYSLFYNRQAPFTAYTSLYPSLSLPWPVNDYSSLLHIWPLSIRWEPAHLEKTKTRCMWCSSEAFLNSQIEIDKYHRFSFLLIFGLVIILWWQVDYVPTIYRIICFRLLYI